ncbi:MAG: tryptophan-rich sensory protein [Ruminococcus sp.]|nr:tryptophan-rich sensory protein [Candidatus Apopatosoma intestinale]
MNSRMLDAKRRVRRELSCINMALVIAFCAGALLLFVFFAVTGVKREVVEELIFPRVCLSPFFFWFFFTLSVLFFAAGAAAAVSTPTGRNGKEKGTLLLLFFCSLVLLYAWLPITYTAAKFFLSVLLILVLLIALAAQFTLAMRINRVAAYLFFAFAIWAFYLLYYSFSLFLLN